MVEAGPSHWFWMSVKPLLCALLPDFALGYAKRIEASPIGSRLARGAFWSLAGAVISRGLTLLSSILVARFLGKVGFGELGIIQSTVGMFATFAGFGLGLTATKHVAEYRVADPLRAGRIMALSGIIAFGTGSLAALLLVGLGPWLAEHTLAAPHLGWLLQLGGALLLFGAVTGAQTGALSGFEAFRAIAVVNLASGIAAFPLMVSGAALMGLRGAVWGLIASAAMNWVLNHVALRREAARAGVPFAMAGCRLEWPTLWRFSVPATLTGAMIMPVYWICNTMLVNQPNGYAEMGIFNAASQWRGAILLVPTSVAAILLPILAGLQGSGDATTFMKIFRFNLIGNGLLAALTATPIALLSPLIMRTYGASFGSGYMVLALMALLAVVMAVTGVMWQALTSCGLVGWTLVVSVAWAVVIVVAMWLLKDRGAMGLAIAALTAHGVQLVGYWLCVRYALRPKVLASSPRWESPVGQLSTPAL
jgi:O-antigen/teichoic acid export membrane protein